MYIARGVKFNDVLEFNVCFESIVGENAVKSPYKYVLNNDDDDDDAL